MRVKRTIGYGEGGYGEGFYGGWKGPGLYPSNEYYYGLITSQYQSSPKFMALVKACLKYLDDALPLALTIHQNFDLDTAVGVQLDILGMYLGVGRTVSFQPSNDISPVLDDDTFRILLRAKLAQNHWDGTIDGLQASWKLLFPGGVITIIDNQNMSVDVVCSGSFSSIVEDLITNGYIIPRPEGVLMNITFGNKPFFGFDYDNDYIAGFDKGKFI
jgi:hypothetical protein